MENSYKFTAIAIISVSLAIFGLSLLSPNSYNSASNNNLFASVARAVSFGDINTSGNLLTSFDNFENIHNIILDKNTPLKISGIYKGEDMNTFWTATDHGMFLSRDGGLTWNSFASSNNEITKNTRVFSVVPISQNGSEFILSVFSNNVGSVYITHDSLFTLTKIVDFPNEVPYAIYKNGNLLYLGMSNGQIIKYNLYNNSMKVVGVMNRPITKIYKPINNQFYILLSSGELFGSNGMESEFHKIKIPGNSGIFSIWSNPIINDVEFSRGGMFVLSNNKVFVSHNNGESFKFLKTIPITEKEIHALSVHDGIIRTISSNRMLSSIDGGDTWVMQDILGAESVTNIYFIGGKIFLGR